MEYHIKLHSSFDGELDQKVLSDPMYPFYLAKHIETYQTTSATEPYREYLYTSHISREGHSRQSFPASQLCEVRLQYHFLTRLRLNTQALHNYV